MPFQSLGGKICNNCLDQIDLDFAFIRDYIYQNPGVFSIDRVCEETGVKKRTVLHLIAEKRLAFSTPEGGVFSCTICHKPIPEGSMCDDCKNELSITLGAAIVNTPERAEDKKSPASGRRIEKMHIRGDKE